LLYLHIPITHHILYKYTVFSSSFRAFHWAANCFIFSFSGISGLFSFNSTRASLQYNKYALGGCFGKSACFSDFCSFFVVCCCLAGCVFLGCSLGFSFTGAGFFCSIGFSTGSSPIKNFSYKINTFFIKIGFKNSINTLKIFSGTLRDFSKLKKVTFLKIQVSSTYSFLWRLIIFSKFFIDLMLFIYFHTYIMLIL